MKVLMLCNKSPYPAREGGPIAMNMIAEGLLEAGHQVRILAVNSDKYCVDPDCIDPAYREKTGIELVHVDLSVKWIPAFFNLFTDRSYHVERFISPVFRSKLIEVLRKESFDIVQFEMLFMSPYLDTVRNFSRARAVLRPHNIEHMIWQRIADNTRNPLKKFYLDHLSRTLRQYELSVLQRFDGIVPITEEDAKFFREALRPATRNIPVSAIPFGIDADHLPEPSGPVEFPSLFSLGAMNWIPNEEGIRWFLDQVWPEVHARMPSLKYYLAGRHMPAWLAESRYPGVEVVGEVADAWEFMQSKAIMLVPLFSGSGIRIKIIEGMAAGKTIISTSIGAEGIRCTNGRDIRIADTAGQFLREIETCARDAALCRRTGEEARRLVSDQYSRRKLIGRLTAFYREIME
ncbi:MAG TPA: glycosyltransferase family 4 protein [Bacteroidales bacterium]|nr:glycosyltransferase family 4 protein [Bacteroidales bacterium]